MKMTTLYSFEADPRAHLAPNMQFLFSIGLVRTQGILLLIILFSCSANSLHKFIKSSDKLSGQ